MNDAPLPEPLEQFLQTPPSLAIDAAMQQAILQQTMSSLPRRRGRWVMLGAVAASMVLAFGAGWILSRAWHGDPPPQTEIVVFKTADPPKEEPKVPLIVPLPTNARELEWTAFDTMDDSERAKLYFRAGDLYLEKHDDISSALRCYRQAIASCDADEIAFDPNDNWLVLALKNDNRKER